MKKTDFVFNYRVRNWADYNRALVRRGSLTVWVDEQAISGWRHDTRVRSCGRPRLYSDAAIECALVIKAVFHLSLRATQGFLESVLTMMRVQLPVPDYTTMCRRQRGLDVQVGNAALARPQHIVIDTTGLKVFGAGEWNLRKHGMRRGRRRIWRKLHLGVDETTKQIVAVDLTTSRLHDCLQLPEMLSGVVAESGRWRVNGGRGEREMKKADFVFNYRVRNWTDSQGSPHFPALTIERFDHATG